MWIHTFAHARSDRWLALAGKRDWWASRLPCSVCMCKNTSACNVSAQKLEINEEPSYCFTWGYILKQWRRRRILPFASILLLVLYRSAPFWFPRCKIWNFPTHVSSESPVSHSVLGPRLELTFAVEGTLDVRQHCSTLNHPQWSSLKCSAAEGTALRLVPEPHCKKSERRGLWSFWMA